MSQIKKFTVRTNAGGYQTFNVQHYRKELSSEFYTGDAFNKAISGRLRQNLRGVRPVYTIKHEHKLDSEKIRDIADNILQDIVTDGRDHVFIVEGDGNTPLIPVIPTEDFLYEIKFLDQFGQSPDTLEFIKTSFGDAVEGGAWVEREWVEAEWVE